LEERFLSHKKFYGSFAYFDPKRFADITTKKIIPDLKAIVDILPPSLNICEDKLVEELTAFASAWPSLKKKSFKEMHRNDSEADSENEDEVEEDVDMLDDVLELENLTPQKKMKRECEECFICILKILKMYNLYTKEFRNLFKTYKFLLTIPITQVTCERSFSKLPQILRKLRNRLSTTHLEALFLMNTERELVNAIDDEVIMKNLSLKSKEMRNLLYY
jgi:hypothetical protein